MHFDEINGDKLYKVLVTKPRKGSYFIIMSKINNGVVNIEFGSKNIDGTPGVRYEINGNYIVEQANKEIDKLKNNLNSYPTLSKIFFKEEWKLYDFTQWKDLSTQLQHAKSIGWNLKWVNE